MSPMSSGYVTVHAQALRLGLCTRDGRNGVTQRVGGCRGGSAAPARPARSAEHGPGQSRSCWVISARYMPGAHRDACDVDAGLRGKALGAVASPAGRTPQ
jgi:hypothetical protein